MTLEVTRVYCVRERASALEWLYSRRWPLPQQPPCSAQPMKLGEALGLAGRSA